MDTPRRLTQKLPDLDTGPITPPTGMRSIPPTYPLGARAAALARSVRELPPAHLPTPPGPKLALSHCSQGPREQITLSCELAPPNFPREAMLDMCIARYRAETGEMPGHLYVSWVHLLEHMAQHGNATWRGIALHVKKGIGFWACECTRYPLAGEE